MLLCFKFPMRFTLICLLFSPFMHSLKSYVGMYNLLSVMFRIVGTVLACPCCLHLPHSVPFGRVMLGGEA